MGCTMQGSPSIAVLPPDEGADLPEIALVGSAQFFSESQSCRPEGSGIDVLSAALSSAVVSFPQKVLLVDTTSNLHPFSTHRLDAGPVRRTTIAHAQGEFNCTGAGGRLSLFRGKWCADEPRVGYRCGAPGISAICVSSTRRLWLPAPSCVCAVEDGPVGGI